MSSFYCCPLEVYYSYTISFAREALRRGCEAKNQTEFEFVRDGVDKAMSHAEDHFRDAHTLPEYISVSLDPDCWYILRLGEADGCVFFYVFGVKLTVVCPPEFQYGYRIASSAIDFFFEAYFHRYVNGGIVLRRDREADEDGLVVHCKCGKPKRLSERFEMMEKYQRLKNQKREKEEREIGEELEMQRFFDYVEVAEELNPN